MKMVIWLTLTIFIENSYAFGLEQLEQKKYLFTGEIIQEDVNSFIHLPDHADIYIDSQGGDGIAAFEIAKIINKKMFLLSYLAAALLPVTIYFWLQQEKSSCHMHSLECTA